MEDLNYKKEKRKEKKEKKKERKKKEKRDYEVQWVELKSQVWQEGLQRTQLEPTIT